MQDMNHEIRSIEREVRDLDEAIGDAADISATARLRASRNALIRRLEELEREAIASAA